MSTNSFYTLNLSTANFDYTQSLEIHAKQDDDDALIAYLRAHIDDHQAPHYIYWSKASNQTSTLITSLPLSFCVNNFDIFDKYDQ